MRPPTPRFLLAPLALFLLAGSLSACEGYEPRPYTANDRLRDRLEEDTAEPGLVSGEDGALIHEF